MCSQSATRVLHEESSRMSGFIFSAIDSHDVLSSLLNLAV